MTEKEEEEIDDPKDLEQGDLLAFGSINLLFTLNLDEHYIKKYKIKWKKLESIENLKFIHKHHRLWKKIELSSKNNTLNILLHINKSSKKIKKIGYVAFKEIIYKDKQSDFEEFIKSVLSKNGLYITSCNICNCTISIQLLLKYENKEKIFTILGDPESNKNDEDLKREDDNKIQKEHVNDNQDEKNSKDDENKSNKDKTEQNPFVKINTDIIEPNKFNYIYFNYNDYINGEFSNKIKMNDLYEYIQTLKITTKSKIILNFEEENVDVNDNLRDLLALSDFYIFYNKNRLYDTLKQLKEQEDNFNTEKLYEYHYKEVEKRNQEKEKSKQAEEEIIKEYKNFLEKQRNELEKLKAKKNIDKTLENNEQNKNTIKNKKEQNIDNKNNSKKENIYITQSSNENDKESEINKVNEIINTENNKEENKEDLQINNTLKTEPSNNAQKKNKVKDIIKRKSNSLTKKNKLFLLKPTLPPPLAKNDLFDYFKFGICDRDPKIKTNEKILLVLDEFNKIFFIKCNRNNTKPEVSDFDLKLYPQMNMRNMKQILEFKKFIKSKFNEYVIIFIGTLLSAILSKGQEKINENTLFYGYLCATNTIKKLAEIQKNNLPTPKEREFLYPTINKNEIEKMIEKAKQRKKEQLFILDGNKKSSSFKPYNPLLDKNLFSYFNSTSNKNFLQLNGFINKDGEINYDPVYRETLGFSKLLNKDEKDSQKCLQTTNKFLFGYKRKEPSYSIYNESKNELVLPPISQIKRQPSIDKKRDTIDEEDNESGSGSGSGSGGSGNGGDSGSGSGSGSGDEN